MDKAEAKVCVKNNIKGGGGGSETDRQTDIDTDTDRQRQRQTDGQTDRELKNLIFLI